jgi:hypothetical protein
MFLAGIALSLSGGFLTKGPVVFVIVGSGVLSLFITTREVRSVIWRRKVALTGTLLLFLGVTAPWFLYAYTVYSDFSVEILQQEMAARNIGNIGNFSLLPVIGAALIAFPWTFMLIHVLIRPKSFPSRFAEIGSRRATLILWVGLSILPFFLIKTFMRYLIGSLVPIALLCALAIGSNNQRMVQIHARLGMVMTSLLVLFFAGFAWWFKISMIEIVIVLVALGIFGVVWWRSTEPLALPLTATVLWMTLIGFLYPTLGINAIPPRIFKEVEGKQVILYRDQQPSLLPIKIGRSLKVTGALSRSDFSSGRGRNSLIFAKEEDAADLERDLAMLGVNFERLDSFKTLNSRVSWIKFARKGTTWNDWILAMQHRSLEPIKMNIILYGLKSQAG